MLKTNAVCHKSVTKSGGPDGFTIGPYEILLSKENYRCLPEPLERELSLRELPEPPEPEELRDSLRLDCLGASLLCVCRGASLLDAGAEL